MERLGLLKTINRIFQFGIETMMIGLERLKRKKLLPEFNLKRVTPSFLIIEFAMTWRNTRGRHRELSFGEISYSKPRMANARKNFTRFVLWASLSAIWEIL